MSGKIIGDYYFFYNNKTPFSQWTRTNMYENSIIYNCCEQYQMYKKAMLFGDYDTAEKILKTLYPSEQKDLGRTVRNFNQEIWDKRKEEIVFNGNLLKFTQNTDFKYLLFSTGDLILVEASKNDSIWGIGLSIDEVDPNDKSKWGLNLLGKCLMDVRNVLENRY